MSRSTQFIGLNDRAIQLIQGLVAKKTHGTTGMFGEVFPLHTYYKGDNEWVYVEEEQAVIWSSGPMIFTALRRVNKNKTGGFGWVVQSLWTDKELAAFK